MRSGFIIGLTSPRHHRKLTQEWLRVLQIEAAEAAAQDPAEPAASILTKLGLADYEAALAVENVATAADICLLTRDDLKELGFKIGDRNKLLAWAALANA